MEMRTVAVGVLVVLAIGLAYFILSGSSARYVPEGNPVSSDVFLGELFNASPVYIVMDVRGTDAATKQNILQCGTDFASSMIFANRNLSAMSIEDQGCTKLEGRASVAACIEELKDGAVIYIQGQAGPKATSQFYRKAIVVGMGQSYTLGQCGIRINELPAPAQ